MLRTALIVTCLSWLSEATARAEVRPHALFSDNMVLQQGMKVPIWGRADDGEAVTVSFQGQKVKALASDGNWMVRLDSLKSGGPFEMTIAGKNTIKLKNVLVGEVWIASGQSNMEWPAMLTSHPRQTVEDSANPMIRLFTVPHTPSTKLLHEVKGKWVECGPATVGGFSAVAYFFGRDLQKARNVPAGLIHSSWGGTVAEAWTSRKTLESYPELKGLVDHGDQLVRDYPKEQDRYLHAIQDYTAEAERMRKADKLITGAPPLLPGNPANNPNVASNLYNGMIAPLQPYAFRGVIWYQGESNVGRAQQYQVLFPALIKDWREHWAEGDFPFLFVQLAPFQAVVKEPQESAWAELCEAQLLTTARVPNTAMAVITDVGHPYDIHPRQKAPVGARLALAARALAYGEQIECSGPVYESMTVEGNRAILSFTHAEGGLVAKGGPLVGFTIAGEDHKFVNAEAVIQDGKVVASSSNVAKPVAVRFGWANHPVVNLWNKAGLPASPFRTDRTGHNPSPKNSKS
jgi:sialate O-acetylesterase